MTVHLHPREAARVDAAAARAGVTRHDFARDVLLERASDDAPLLACLGTLIAIHHRLDGERQFDDALRAEIVRTVHDLAAAARAEVAA